MDRIQEISDLIIQLNRFQKKEIFDHQLIPLVCDFFDKVKTDELTQADKKFLYYVSNIAGLPHYYDLLLSINQDRGAIEYFTLNTLSSSIYESSLQKDEFIKIHRYQKQVLDQFQPNAINRFLLSASTSFGKTFVVYEVIKKMRYKNVLLIFPTIALLSENLERILSRPEYVYFKENYHVHTLSEVSDLKENNLFIYTPERFLSFIEKQDNIHFDFSFVDEIYKLDNDYLIDVTTQENERDVAYRVAIHYLLKYNSDLLFAGPYIEFNQSDNSQNNKSFETFLSQNNIRVIDYNNYEIVNKKYVDVKSKTKVEIDESLKVVFESSSKSARLIQLVKLLKQAEENVIVYCSRKSSCETYSRKLIDGALNPDWDISSYSQFIDHIAQNFPSDWIILAAIRSGIGIHHGLVPKYIQKEIIELFNSGKLNTLVSTTTITEGVNTSAKNLIVLHAQKGEKKLKKFDAKNISGRAGRFLFHYSGRIILLDKEFKKIIDGKEDGLRHKNYDFAASKNDVDLFYTDDTFLNDFDKAKKAAILNDQLTKGIPDEVFNRYKVVSRLDKLTVYDNITLLTQVELESIVTLIRQLNINMKINFDGIETILKCIQPIVKHAKLLFLIKEKRPSSVNSNEYSILTYLLHFYLQDGFKGSMDYNIKRPDFGTDKGIRETAEFIYNILKYQVSKYFGVFNVMYRHFISQARNAPYEEVSGIDRLLIKLEYNALTEFGRLASDYGVPSRVLEYYENPSQASTIKAGFDAYEQQIFDKFEKIINAN